MVYIYIYIYHQNQQNVGKYTSPMDPMGLTYQWQMMKIYLVRDLPTP